MIQLSPKLETTRLLLKKHDSSLAGLMYAEIDQDRKRLEEFLPWVKNLKSKQNELRYILSTHERWEEGSLFDYSILNQADQKFMGAIGVHTLDWQAKACELGYWILAKFEGQGYIAEAVRTLEKHLFEKGFNRIEIRCHPMNKRSARIPIGCGYLFDGCLEQEFVLHEKLENTWIFSKVKKNYQQSFVAEMTLADTDRLFEIAKASPEHFTKLGLENLHVDLQNQLGLVIRHEDRICGFLLYFTHQGKAEISWMAIDPKYRSRGFGKKLLECLKDRLKSTGARDLTVRTLGDQVKYKPYDGTRRFYLHNGFKKLQSILHADNPECPEEWVMGCLIK